MNIGFWLFTSRNKILGTVWPQYAANMATELFLTPRRYPLKEWERRKESEGRRLALNNGLSAITWGASERKILLVHGWESRGTQLSGFVDTLLAEGFQVIALDGPAHGQSKGRQANPAAFSQAVSQAFRQLGPFEGVLAHSMGGSALGLSLAEDIQCDKVVLISSPSSIVSVLQRFAGFIGLPRSSTERFIGMVERNVGRPADALDTAKNLSLVASAGLIIHDKRDREVPYDNALDILRQWPSAQLLSTDGYGHRAILRQPEVWHAVADFFRVKPFS